jgi:hypothetical protein
MPGISSTLLAGAGILCAAVVMAQEPTKEEQGRFNDIKARLIKHKEQWPESVDRAIDTMGSEVSIEQACPSGTALLGATLKFRTKLVTWQARPGDEGGYIPSCAASVANGKSTIDCAGSQLMLDTGGLVAEDSEFSKISNESLLYHELLHVQFWIDARNDLTQR